MSFSRTDGSANWVPRRPLTFAVSLIAAIALTITTAPAHAVTLQPELDLTDQQAMIVEEMSDAIEEVGVEPAVENVDVKLPYSAEHAASLLTDRKSTRLNSSHPV